MAWDSRIRSPPVQVPRYQIAWSFPGGSLLAIEPRPAEVELHVAALAAAYNDPHNAPLLGHTERMTERDVALHYASLANHGGRGFLVFRDGALVADADLRNVARGAAEFAFMVAEVAAQGRGLGTRIATMIHVLAFGQLQLQRVYASIMPKNVASRRVFEKLGYRIETGPIALSYAEDHGDIAMVIDRPTFTRSHTLAMAEVQIAVR
jgi:RimJ/RimL family protein N-acetyltransferase